MWATLGTMYKTEGGFLALYRGITPTVAGVAPYVRYTLQFANEVFQLSVDQGRLKLHDLRIRAEMVYSRRGQESIWPPKISCWCYFGRRCSNVHLSIVCIPQIHLPSIHFNMVFHSDVLRRRFQINTMSGIGYQYKSIWDAITVILTQEGIRGLYKGIVPNLLKVAPSMASSWLSYEITRDFFLGLSTDE